MQYHAVSLCNSGLFEGVHIVGYDGTSSGYNSDMKKLLDSNQMSILSVKSVEGGGRGIIGLFKKFWKFIVLSLSIFFQLFRIPSPLSLILVQNPPSVPTLLVVKLVSVMRGSRVMVDWHNYGYSLLSLSLGSEDHFLVKFYKKMETHFGKKAKLHLCVTQAMKEDLKSNWNIDATVLYDRPPLFFRRCSLSSQHQVLSSFIS